MNKYTQDKFDRWTNLASWASGHELDDERFFDFIKAAFLDDISPSVFTDALKAKIALKYPLLNTSTKENAIITASARYEDIYRFLKYIKYKEYGA